MFCFVRISPKLFYTTDCHVHIIISDTVIQIFKILRVEPVIGVYKGDILTRCVIYAKISCGRNTTVFKMKNFKTIVRFAYIIAYLI